MTKKWANCKCDSDWVNWLKLTSCLWSSVNDSFIKSWLAKCKLRVSYWANSDGGFKICYTEPAIGSFCHGSGLPKADNTSGDYYLSIFRREATSSDYFVRCNSKAFFPPLSTCFITYVKYCLYFKTLYFISSKKPGRIMVVDSKSWNWIKIVQNKLAPLPISNAIFYPLLFEIFLAKNLSLIPKYLTHILYVKGLYENLYRVVSLKLPPVCSNILFALVTWALNTNLLSWIVET